MIAEIGTLLASSRAAYDIAKGLGSVYIDDKVRERTTELLSILLSVQATASAVYTDHQTLLKEKDDLEKKIMELEKWSDTEAQYQMTEVAPDVFVYAYKKTDDSPKPSHWVCPKCFQEKTTHFLQRTFDGDYYREYSCPNCKNVIKINKKPHEYPPPEDSGGSKNWMAM